MGLRVGENRAPAKITLAVLQAAAAAGKSVPEVARQGGWQANSVRNACVRHKIALRGMGSAPRKAGPTPTPMPAAADLPPIDDSHVDAVGCRALWQSVLLEQVRLALTVGAAGGEGGFGYSNPADQARARSWIGTRDFHMVCALAGLEGDAVLQALQGLLVQARAQEALRDAALAAGRGFRPWGPGYRQKRIK
ncbi:MAG: hypothetical protein ACRCYS_09320 [Beijerinckiaceae bacterium]